LGWSKCRRWGKEGGGGREIGLGGDTKEEEEEEEEEEKGRWSGFFLLREDVC